MHGWTGHGGQRMPKKKKSAELTPRQRLSQRIMREKAARKKRLALRRKLQMVGLASGAAVVVVGGGWLWLSGTAAHMADTTVNGLYKMTSRAGFKVQAVYLEGRNRTSMQEINKALDLAKGQSIFQVDIDDTRRALEKIESVQLAAVERALPHTLYVRIVEREPVALWQNEGKLTPVDNNGIVMHGVDSAPYTSLPLITGPGAPAHITELMTILASDADLAKRFAAAMYIGERRWTIRLKNGIEVKLPEDNPAAAWKSLADLQTREHLLDRAVKVVDFRISGKLFVVTTSPQVSPRRAADAKET
jgi:cell division protein FtsQ